jgi:UDP-2,3-diacylglucosamine hydrolase
VILFISDLHLDASRPHITRAFYHFLANEGRQAEALYILGDLFELWIGDDDDSPLVLEVQSQLRSLVNGGTRLYFMHGNRDFLIGEGFAESAGATLLQDPHAMEVGGERLVLMHGDRLCTDDHEYQAFRQQVRQPQWMAAVLAKPLEERRILGRQIRAQSQSMNSRKPEDIMDVTSSEVRSVIEQYGADKMIHGHTHRPARHALENGERIVLGDWEEQAWCLRYDGNWELYAWDIPGE